MENSYTETSPLFSSAINNNKHQHSNGGFAATVIRLQKESFTTSLTQLVDAASDPEPKDSEQEGETVLTETVTERNTIHDPAELAKAQEQRRSLLDALIKALTNFTNQFSEEEDAEVVTAVIKSHLYRFHPSRSYDCLQTRSHKNPIRTSATLHNFISNNIHNEEAQEVSPKEPKESVPFLSPISIIKSPESYHSSSEQDSSTSERLNALKNSQTWQQWSSLKRSELIIGEETHDSLTMLLTETSDDEDVIYL